MGAEPLTLFRAGAVPGAHKKSLRVRDTEANSERNSHSPPQKVVVTWL